MNSATVTFQEPTWQKRTAAQQRLIWFGWLIFLTVVVYAWRLLNQNTVWEFVTSAPTQAKDLALRMSNPKWSYMSELWRPLWDTLNIATLGTLFGIIAAIPLAFLAAHNTTPHRLLVRPIALVLMVASRSVNSLIWGLLFVAVFGPGILAGILAIGFRSVGFVAKLFFEAIEEIDKKQVEAIVATGASRSQIIQFGVLPQILPTLIGVTVFRWDINIRESTILGLVGAGGIGLQLMASVNILAWNQVVVILLLILGTVFVSEWLSARVRKAIV